MFPMNKTTKSLVAVLLIILGFVLVYKMFSNPAPMPEPEETETEETETAPETSTNTAPRPASVEGNTYRLSSYNGNPLSEGSDYLVSFDGGHLSAKFCNNMGGAYEISGGTLKVPQLVSTMMYCGSPNYIMGYENFFSKLVSQGAAYSLIGNRLVLADANNSMVFLEVEN